MRKWLLGLLAAAAAIAVAFLLSPWPSVYIIRAIFDKGVAEASGKLEKHVPATVSLHTLHYDQADSDAVLDVLRPA
ncbi:hypothetical protein [Sphingomonas sp. LaA6.9]|uniref:hypothetical protein n=1 Tax=Sphingomonas sp. LaA6.9 TaxID=2919914 RepID=UPI001F4F96F6|nr:hypothetical protein [Sphingomonas sp. LaA6.9]MCJ8156861.1 hypothetical protein [Sphingomonas sp. LaA6.9]